MKELLVFPRALDISILVPKQRGTGYVKVPLGHHQNALAQIAYDIGFDLWGLDGSLDVQTGYNANKLDALLEQIMPPLAAHYGMTWRLVDTDEYHTNHPIKT